MIDYSITINIVGIWTAFTPSINECSFIKKEESGQIFERTTLDGALKFYDAEYDTLKTQSASNNYLDIRISYDSDLIVIGYLDLLGKWNDAEKICELEVIANDAYKKVIENFSTKYKLNIDDPLCYTYRVGYPSISASFAIKGARKLENIIKYFLSKINNAILFDEDSWIPFNTGDNWRKIYIASFADALSGDSEDYTLQETEMSLEDVFNLLKRANIYWKIENSGGNDYFRLVHISTISKTVGVGDIYDLSTYKSTNWSKMFNNWQWLKDSRFYRKTRKNLGKYDSMRGRDILIPSLENTAVIQEDDYTLFCADVEDMFDDITKENRKYPIGSDGSWVIMVADEDATTLSERYITSSSSESVSLAVVMDSTPSNWVVRCDANCSNVKGFLNSDSYAQPQGATINVKFEVVAIGGFAIPESVIIKNPHMYPDDGYEIAAAGVYDLTFYSKEYQSSTNFNLHVTGDINDRMRILANQLTSYNFHTVEWLKGIQNFDIEGFNVWNYHMGMEYIDDTYGGYDLPDSPAIINDVSTTVTIKKQKQSDAISFPCNNPNEINFDYLIDLGFGTLDPKELKIPLDKRLATVTGLFY